MEKRATTDYGVHDLIAERWSPRSFADRDVSREDLGALLEAARWAPSCFNEQPWRFLVATRADREGFARLAGCLVEGNAWAREAPVLMVAVAKLAFDRNGKPNRHAAHDVGLALGSLVLQAQALGLATHQMAGFDAERARSELGIPEGFEAMTMVAIGYRGPAESLPDGLREREQAPRERQELAAIAFGARWGAALS